MGTELSAVVSLQIFSSMSVYICKKNLQTMRPMAYPYLNTTKKVLIQCILVLRDSLQMNRGKEPAIQTVQTSSSKDAERLSKQHLKTPKLEDNSQAVKPIGYKRW
jgi:hypothetical protein